MIMKALVSSALAVAIAASIGTVAVDAKEHGGYRTAEHRRHASQPYLNVWGSRVYLDRPGY
jgi:hypothetical protein